MVFQWLESPFPNIDRQKFLVLGRTARNSPDLPPPKNFSWLEANAENESQVLQVARVTNNGLQVP